MGIVDSAVGCVGRDHRGQQAAKLGHEGLRAGGCPSLYRTLGDSACRCAAAQAVNVRWPARCQPHLRSLFSHPSWFVRSGSHMKEMMYVEAARSLGASPARIVLRHILPNTFAPVIVLTSITVGTVIIIETALDYLGLSVRIPQATWGNMLNTGAAKWEQHPLLALAPGFAIIITVFAINLLGDGLRDELDPRLRGKK
ncbi:MAG: ABC transporter permease [Dehalococcoidia bacterium]